MEHLWDHWAERTFLQDTGCSGSHGTGRLPFCLMGIAQSYVLLSCSWFSPWHSGHPDPVGSAHQLIGVNTLTWNHGGKICPFFSKCSQLMHAPLLQQAPATEGLAEDQNEAWGLNLWPSLSLCRKYWNRVFFNVPRSTKPVLPDRVDLFTVWDKTWPRFLLSCSCSWAAYEFGLDSSGAYMNPKKNQLKVLWLFFLSCFIFL